MSDCASASDLQRMRVRPSHPPRRATRPTASPRRSGGGNLRERAKVASTRSSPSENSSSLGSSGTSRPSRTINWMRQPTTILMAMARSRRSAVWVLQLLDLAPGLEDAEVVLDAPAKGVPAKDSLGVGGAGHGQRSQHEPLQRLGLGGRALLAGVHDPQLDRRRPGARQRNGLVAQRHLGAARRPAALGGLFAGLHPPEASDTLRRGCVEHVVKSGKIAPQAVPDLILNLHGGHGSEVAS